MVQAVPWENEHLFKLSFTDLQVLNMRLNSSFLFRLQVLRKGLCYSWFRSWIFYSPVLFLIPYRTGLMSIKYREGRPFNWNFHQVVCQRIPSLTFSVINSNILFPILGSVLFAPHLTRQHKFYGAFFSNLWKLRKAALQNKPWIQLLGSLFTTICG